MVRAIAFDFDGVLVESVEIKTAAFARLFAGEPPELVERILAYHRAHGGISQFEKFRTIYRDILRRPLDEAASQALGERFAALVVDALVAAPWVEGAQEFLAAHRGRYRSFVVSGTPEPELRAIVQRRAMERYFDEVLGSPAPKEALLQGLLDRHRLRPEELAFVGDAQTDWLAAQQARIPFIWRVAPDAPPLDGFTGPRIASLRHLDRALAGSVGQN
ncbi:MAG: HAD family hydrolase [Candidatus Omnitrophica bacterium]|nr:HAD family hydrolase [Candidatus Omnitrophota bacterium]